MSKGSRQKRQTQKRRYVECVVCQKSLQPHEWPQDPRDPGLCEEHAKVYSVRRR